MQAAGGGYVDMTRLLLARERAQCERVTELMVGLEAGLEESKAR